MIEIKQAWKAAYILVHAPKAEIYEFHLGEQLLVVTPVWTAILASDKSIKDTAEVMSAALAEQPACGAYKHGGEV